MKRSTDRKSLIDAHRRGDHVLVEYLDKTTSGGPSAFKGCRLCAGRPDTRCDACMHLRCIGCNAHHCAEHCRGRKPNALRVIAKRVADQRL